MVSISFFIHAILLGATAAARLDPRWANGESATGITDPWVTDKCDLWANDIQYGDSCESLESDFGFTLQEFRAWNPSLFPSCVLIPGWSYCVAGPDETTTSTNTTPDGTHTDSGITAPTQRGIIPGCTKYHLVKSDDTCESIQNSYTGFTLDQFYSWNPSISKGCAGFQPGYYVCVAAGSSSSTTTTNPTMTTTSTATTPGTDESLSASNTIPSTYVLILSLMLAYLSTGTF